MAWVAVDRRPEKLVIESQDGATGTLPPDKRPLLDVPPARGML